MLRKMLIQHLHKQRHKDENNVKSNNEVKIKLKKIKKKILFVLFSSTKCMIHYTLNTLYTQNAVV